MLSIKLCRMAGSIILFKITGMLTSENVKLKRNILWDVIELRLEGSQCEFEWK